MRACIRGCTVLGLHYAACPWYGSSAETSECPGCVPREARDGALLCERCYRRLRRGIEDAPELVGMLRSKADPLKAATYDKMGGRAPAEAGSPAPVSVDLIDAADDIMRTLGGRPLAPGEASDVAYAKALDLAGIVLAEFDAIVNDGDVVLEWWEHVCSMTVQESPEFWTVARVRSRWPLEERVRWANGACPECGLRSVRVFPPRNRYSLLRFACGECGWSKSDQDDDGLWAAAFGFYADVNGGEKVMGSTSQVKPDIDVSAAFKAGTDYLLAHPVPDGAGPFGPFAAFLIGATPALAEEFARVADTIAKNVREEYRHGDLIAGGAKLVARALRQAVEGAEVAAEIEAQAREAKE